MVVGAALDLLIGLDEDGWGFDLVASVCRRVFLSFIISL